MTVKEQLLSKAEAFGEEPEDLKSISINKKGAGFRFSRRWFILRNQTTWSTFFTKEFDGEEPLHMIQIGVFEGMDLVWCLQNILQHRHSRVVAIDPWLDTTKLSQDTMNKCYANAVNNLGKFGNRVKIIREKSEIVLPNLLRPLEISGVEMKPNDYDLIVIDGDHTAPAVYADAVYSLKLAKPGGWLVFDDYYNRVEKQDHVKHGVAQFLEEYGDEVRFEWQHRFSLCLSKI